jgi:hypothetical protein
VRDDATACDTSKIVLAVRLLLQQLRWPFFRVAFQMMIFPALLESGSGSVHEINQRIGSTFSLASARPVSDAARLAVAGVVLSFLSSWRTDSA